MSKAVLEIETPQSCRDCEISHEVYAGNKDLLRCPRVGFLKERDNADNTRHPDCPLKITEGIETDICKYCKDEIECLINKKWLECKLFTTQNKRRWICQPTNISPAHNYHCPKCNMISINATNYCERCGIKLLPPEENTQ